MKTDKTEDKECWNVEQEGEKIFVNHVQQIPMHLLDKVQCVVI